MNIPSFADLPLKTEDHLTLANTLPAALRIGPIHPSYKEWHNTVKAHIADNKIVIVGEHPVLRMDATYGKKPLCLHKDAVPALRELLNLPEKPLLPEKTKNDLNLSEELPNELNASPLNSAYNAWRTKTETQLNAGEAVFVGKYPFTQKQSGSHQPWCLPSGAVPTLRILLNLPEKPALPEKTENDLNLSKHVPLALHVTPLHPVYVEWRTGVEERLDKGEDVSIGGYSIAQKQSASRQSWYLPAEAIPALRELLNLPEKPSRAEKLKKSIKPDDLKDRGDFGIV